jgi:hypothetical protein
MGKILGLKISGGQLIFKNGLPTITPSTIGWSVVTNENPLKLERKEVQSQSEKLILARKVIADFVSKRQNLLSLSDQQICDIAHISLAQLSSIKSGESYSIDDFFIICECLNCYFFLIDKEEHGEFTL